MSGFTDIRRNGWVAHLPPAFQNYAILARADRPIGVWLLFLPGLWSICLAAPGFWRGLWLAFLFALGATVMRGAGCVVNDLWDRDLDAQVERTRGRPLASGAVKPWQAIVFFAALCLIGLGVLLLLGRSAQILGVLSLALVALYPLAKRVTWWPQLVLGCTFGWGAPMGYAAATGHSVERLDYYVVLAIFKLAAIMEGHVARGLAGKSDPSRVAYNRGFVDRITAKAHEIARG